MSTERIWELFSARLKGFLLERVSDEQIAEDLHQETFLRIHKGLGAIHDEERLTAWVFQIARNLVLDQRRRDARPDSRTLDELELPFEDEVNLNELVRDWLPAMIGRLPMVYREAVQLYELERMPQQQIAERLGISLSGVKSRIQRGRQKLKSLLFECCSFERDRRGNIIGFRQNETRDCGACDGD